MTPNNTLTENQNIVLSISHIFSFFKKKLSRLALLPAVLTWFSRVRAKSGTLHYLFYFDETVAKTHKTYAPKRTRLCSKRAPARNQIKRLTHKIAERRCGSKNALQLRQNIQNQMDLCTEWSTNKTELPLLSKVFSWSMELAGWHLTQEPWRIVPALLK